MNHNYFKSIGVLLAVILLPLSCNKDVASQETLYPLVPKDVDATAGTWKPMGVTSYTKYTASVPTPADPSTPAYQAELASIKNLQSVLTKDQQNIISYWSGGGVLRWNQIFRELVARYNLPPAPLANGTYIFPDANNPFADPQFPFANPPYAARAYSYVSVAIFDALKAAWYYKYQYNRLSPYVNDNGVKSLMPQVNIPSYPSEEAVMSAAAQTILVALFPAASNEILDKAGQQRSAALLSGKASATDISVGIALGKAVAADFITRAGGDGMGAAVGNAAQWKAFQDTAKAHGQIPWLSLDLPSRPPMLPFFGNVKAWMLTPLDVAHVRPSPPPSTASTEMTDQVNEVKYYSTNLTRERHAIVMKWADGAGTYTPPGHWNDIAEEYIRDAKFSEVRAARAFALLNAAMHDAAVTCWNTKYYYFNPRPTQMDPSIKTGTGIPNFPSYVSGHSTFSYAAAAVLSYLFPEHEAYFFTQANEASLSRLYGAIHYRIDVEAGSQLGLNTGGFTVGFAQGDGAN
ncbi:MAG TPA: phosphatase PAP2 family protein [Cyclobacteriaceae bacterium]|jgi:membrane-associated phospholipid phosphatase|nr:phosphatase PAP2 family protein [Cyclobacteriaceae bacterium]